MSTDGLKKDRTAMMMIDDARKQKPILRLVKCDSVFPSVNLSL